jgi:hypothetical protein
VALAHPAIPEHGAYFQYVGGPATYSQQAWSVTFVSVEPTEPLSHDEAEAVAEPPATAKAHARAMFKKERYFFMCLYL